MQATGTHIALYMSPVAVCCSVLQCVAVCCSVLQATQTHTVIYMSPAAVCCRESTTETMQATQTHIFIYMSPLAVCCKQPGHIPLYICPLLQFVAANHTPETMQATRTHIFICMSPLAVCCSEINPETMQATLTHNFTYVSCGCTYMFCAYIHMFLVTYMFCAYIHMFLVTCMPCGGGKRVLLYTCSSYPCSPYINLLISVFRGARTGTAGGGRVPTLARELGIKIGPPLLTFPCM